MPQLQLHTLQSSLALFSFVFIHQPSCTNEALTKNVSGLSHMSWKKHNRHHSDNFKIYSWINCLNGWSCKKTFWFILPSMNVTLRRYPLPNHSKWEVIIYGVRMHIQLPTLINPNSTCTETGSTNSLILIPLSVWADWRFIGGNAHAHRWVHTYTQVQCDSHCSWAQTPNLPRNSPGSQPPQMLAPGLWISGATAPLSLLVFRPAHTHIGIYRADIFSPGDPSSAHTHTHTHIHIPAWAPGASLQPSRLWPWSHLGCHSLGSLWSLSPDTQSSPAAGTMIHPWPWLVAPTHGPLKPYGAWPDKAQFAHFQLCFSPHTFIFSQFFPPQIMWIHPLLTSGFFPKHPMAIPKHYSPAAHSTPLRQHVHGLEGGVELLLWPTMMRVIPGHWDWAFPEIALSLCSHCSCAAQGLQRQGCDGLMVSWGTVMSELLLHLSLYSFVNVWTSFYTIWHNKIFDI